MFWKAFCFLLFESVSWARLVFLGWVWPGWRGLTSVGLFRLNNALKVRIEASELRKHMFSLSSEASELKTEASIL